ncbi:stalk domain-containing protein [Ureibacillus sp. GCM10028918]|uniref:stalk domain-containing protein n=1 Tax=Ureibacillus sp. GCM10028918 TaxID=3273429 RepID=UPI00360B5F4F
MNKKTFTKMGKGIATTMVAGFMLFAQTNVSEAAVISKKVETNPQIKILNNSVQVSKDVTPIMVDGTTYLPVRSLSGALNMNVRWEGSSKSIYITDPNESLLRNELQAKINEIYNLENFVKNKDNKIAELEKNSKTKDAKITELEAASKTKDAKIAELERQLKLKSTASLDDLEDQLNDDYGGWEDLELDISLNGDADDIEVEIEIDLDDNDNSDWLEFSDTKIERFINAIADDIWDEFEDAEITGEVIDIAENEELLEFSGEDGDLDIK